MLACARCAELQLGDEARFFPERRGIGRMGGAGHDKARQWSFTSDFRSFFGQIPSVESVVSSY
jgi:hypothetical protein